MTKIIQLPHWQDIDKRLAQEQAIACKEYDEANNELAQLHTQLSLQDGAVNSEVKKHEKHVDAVLDGVSGLTPEAARHCKAYQKALAQKYRHQVAKRMAFPATQKQGGQRAGQPIGR